jgi:hypothetical protein
LPPLAYVPVAQIAKNTAEEASKGPSRRRREQAENKSTVHEISGILRWKLLDQCPEGEGHYEATASNTAHNQPKLKSSENRLHYSADRRLRRASTSLSRQKATGDTRAD